MRQGMNDKFNINFGKPKPTGQNTGRQIGEFETDVLLYLYMHRHFRHCVRCRLLQRAI